MNSQTDYDSKLRIFTSQTLLARFKEHDPELVENKRAYVHGRMNFKSGQ
jgi:hypothetical protein